MKVLILPHLKIHNANALSSPFTVGFPAMTAWLGFVHAIERKLRQAGLRQLMFESVAVISHSCDVQTYRGEGDFVHSIIGTGNPLDKEGSRSPFIEEARCHLDVSLVIAWSGNEEHVQQPDFTGQLQGVIATMKVAGGDILGMQQPYDKSIDLNSEQETHHLFNKLMPGYVLKERRDLMAESMLQGADALDALLEHLTVHHHSEQLEDGSVIWHSQRKSMGWIVPVAVGFQAISPLGEAKNQRDPSVPHCFAESVVSLGEFVMAHKVKHLEDVLWQYAPDVENGLYLCQQINTISEQE